MSKIVLCVIAVGSLGTGAYLTVSGHPKEAEGCWFIAFMCVGGVWFSVVS